MYILHILSMIHLFRSLFVSSLFHTSQSNFNNISLIVFKSSYTVEGRCGMFDSSYFDYSKVIIFENWKVSFLRKKFVSF